MKNKIKVILLGRDGNNTVSYSFAGFLQVGDDFERFLEVAANAYNDKMENVDQAEWWKNIEKNVLAKH